MMAWYSFVKAIISTGFTAIGPIKTQIVTLATVLASGSDKPHFSWGILAVPC